MTKKTALTILGLVVIAAILFIGLTLFFQKQTVNQNPIIETARNFFGGFFPGNNNGSGTQNNNEENNNGEQNQNFVIPKLRQISSFPVAGGIMFDREATTSSLLIQEESGAEQNQKITETVYRFTERATGHIYETTSRDLSQKRITNTTIPKVYQVFFSKDGDSVAMQYLNADAIETFLGKINYAKNSTSTEIISEQDNFATVTGTFLPIKSFSFTKNITSDSFAFLNISDENTLTGITGLYTGNIKNPSQNKKVFDLKTSEWKIQILNDGTLALNTKPSVIAEGFLYFLNPTEGILKKIIGNTPALNSLVSPDGKKTIYSYYNSGTTKMALYDSVTKIYREVFFSTFPREKCVWSEKDTNFVICAVPNNIIRGAFPDIWYQGKFSFNDSFVKINTNDMTYVELMSANSETETNIDAIDLQLSPSEDYLMFINKNDLTLWSLDIL